MSGDFDVDGKLFRSRFDTPTVGLWYPRLDGSAKEIEIELHDVRAADSIRVSYDFNRDGWVIKQSNCDDPEVWTEVSFIKAWALCAEEVC